MQRVVGDKEDGGRYAPGSTSAPRHPSPGPAYSPPPTATERARLQAREREREREVCSDGDLAVTHCGNAPMRNVCINSQVGTAGGVLAEAGRLVSLVVGVTCFSFHVT